MAEASTSSGSAPSALSTPSTALPSTALTSPGLPHRLAFHLNPRPIGRPPSSPAPPIQYTLPLVSATLDSKALEAREGRRLRMTFGGSEAQLGWWVAEGSAGAEEGRMESVLGFKGSSIKGLKVVVNRWSGTEGSDVTVSVFLPSVGQATDAASPLRTLELVADTHHGNGFCPSRFERLKARLRIWGAAAPYGVDISDTQALAIPPPDISLACFDPPPPNYLPSVPSTWVPAFVAPPARSTVYTLRKGSTQAKRTLGGGRPKKAFARASGFAPARAPSLRRSVGPSELGSVDGDESVEPAGFAPARAASSLPRSAGSSRLRAVESVEPVERPGFAPARARSQCRSTGSVEAVEPVTIDDPSDSEAPPAKKARTSTPAPSASTPLPSKGKASPLSEAAQLRLELKTVREQHHKLLQRHESESSRRKKAEKELAAATTKAVDVLRGEMVAMEKRFEARRLADVDRLIGQVKALGKGPVAEGGGNS